MIEQHTQYNPIIVGGLGGSGTRVVAKILEASGIFMGRHLNPEYDNLLFPILAFPARFGWPYEELKPYISLFESMHLSKRLSLRQWMLLAAPLLNKYRRSKQLKMIRYAMQAYRHHNHLLGWGWKYPTNQYFLEQLNRHFPNCFYIHAMRHGLDMAFTKNLRQLEWYGPYLGIFQENSQESVPVQQLTLWIKTNLWVAEYCAKNMPSRHYILRFEELCAFPEKVISELHNAIGLISPTPISELAKIIELPESRDRYKLHDLSIFSPEQISVVQELGYSI